MPPADLLTAPDRAPTRRSRSVDVTAVVVTQGDTEYLPTTLAAVRRQGRAPDRVVVVDVGAEPARLLADRAVTGSGTTVLRSPHARTFGDAVRAVLATLGPAGDGGADDGRDTWLWLLHDDSAPEPAALAELVAEVERAPSVAIAGCKQWTWTDPVRVVEVGVSTSRFGRRMTGLDGAEVDQGQHDGREDVLAVGLAGALVRRDVWEHLGGPDPALGPFGDGLDLCRRARLAGHRVVVVPGAVVRHARASLAQPHHGAVVNRPGWDAARAARAQRAAFLHGQLAGVPLALVPVVSVLAVVSGVVRALGRLVTKEPHLVLGELVVPWSVLLRPHRVVRARRQARRTAVLPRRSLRPLQMTWREVAELARDRRLSALERRRRREAPSELELRELAALRTRRRAGLVTLLLVVLAATVAALGPVLGPVLTGARLEGGTVVPGAADLAAAWDAVRSGWVPADLGRPGTADPALVALLPLVALTGSTATAQAAVLLTGTVAAALGAWFAAGAATRSVALRAWAALVWVAAPALTVAVGQARWGAVLAHALLPWVALGVARGLGVARVDRVRPGTETDDAPLERATAPASLAGVAVASLALAGATAAAPVLLPVAVAAVVVLAVVAPRRRLAWLLVPSLALHGPVIGDAVRTGRWRTLLADPGTPLAADPLPAWQQLLGRPVALPDGVLGEWHDVVAWAAGGTLLALALLALVRRDAPVRGTRTAWALAALALAAGAAAGRVAVGVDGTHGPATGPDALAVVWPGSTTSVVVACLLAAALLVADGVRTDLARRAFGHRHVLAGLVAVAAVLAPTAALADAGLRVADDRGPDRVAGLRADATPVVPAAGRQLQGAPDASRVLRLEPTASAGLEHGGVADVTVTLMRADGVPLTDVGRDTAARLTGPPLTPRTAPDDEAVAEVADVVGALLSGASDDAATRLAALGVGAVVLPPGAADDDPAPRGAVVAALDATLGLERVTETAAGVLWRVAVGDLGSTAAWARLRTADGAETALAARPDRTVTTRVEPGAGGVLVLAERADPGWRAWLDGRPLRAVNDGWRQAFELGPEGGELEVRHVAPDRRPWLVLQGVVLLVSVLLAVPRRRGGAR